MGIFLVVFSLRPIVQQTAVRSQLLTTTSSAKNILVRKNLIQNLLPKRGLSAQHDHSRLWVIEKAVSAGLLAIIPAAFLIQSEVLDYLLAVSIVAHCHWGFEAIVIDYIRPSICGPVIPKVAVASVYLVSIIALAGLFYLNYSDVGLSTAIKMIAKV